MKGLLESARIVAKVNGEWLPVNVKPRHVMAIQKHFASNGDTSEMEQTIYLCWTVLHDDGTFAGTLDEFELALDDIAPAEDDADPK